MASLWGWYREPADEDEPSSKKKKVQEKEASTARPTTSKILEAGTCSTVDVELLSISSSDKDSDLDVLEEVTNRKEHGSKVNADETEGWGQGHPQHALSFNRKHHDESQMKKVSDPTILEAQKRNREALARLHQAAEVAALLDDESSESDIKGGSGSPGKDTRHTSARPSSPLKSQDNREEDTDEKVTLKLVTKARQEQQMRIRSTDPFSKLFDKYRELAVEKGWASDSSKLKFIFDGDEIQGSDTTIDLDMENGVVIDVHIL
eukprot:jgi/Botrbrau1/9732/Bobra.0388s0024.2